MAQPASKRLVTEAAVAGHVAANIPARLSDTALNATIVDGVTEQAPNAMFNVSTNSDTLYSLRMRAQLASAGSSLIASTELTLVSGYTNGDPATWTILSGSIFEFIAPPSGRVKVEITTGYAMPAGVADLTMRIHDIANNPYPNVERRMLYQPAAALATQGQFRYVAHLKNLTPGALIRSGISIRNTSSTTQPQLTSTAPFGPVLVDILSVPAPSVSDTAILVRADLGSQNPYTIGKAAVAAGTRDMKIALGGDSTATGYLLDNPSKRLAGVLAGLGLAAVPGGTTPGLANASGQPGNPRYTAGAGWTSGNIYGFGGQAWVCNNPAGAFSYADPDVNADSFDVIVLRSTTTGPITLQIDSEPAQSFTVAGATGLVKLTITSTVGASTAHTLKVTTADSTAVSFVDPWLSTARRIRVANMGAPSTNSITWATGDGVYSRSAMALYAPDVVIFLIGVNDAVGGVPTSTVIANIKTMAAATPNALFIISTPFPSQGADEQARTLQYALHERYELPYPLIDIGRHFGTWDEAFAKGWMGDLRHPSATGMGVQASLYAKMLEPSLVVTPAPAT